MCRICAKYSTASVLLTGDTRSGANRVLTGTSGVKLERLARIFFHGVTLASLAMLTYTAAHFQSIQDPRALCWYGVGVCGVILGIVGRRLRTPAGIGLALFLVISVAVVMAAELFVEGLQERRSRRDALAIEALTGRERDPRSVPDVVRDLRASGVPAFPSIVPQVMLDATAPETPQHRAFAAPFMPLAGVSRAETVQLCNEDGRYHTYQSDRYGFNNPDAVWDSSEPKIVLIGDSFTHGYCVPSDSTLASQMRKVWPATLNLGTGGSGPLAELAILTEYGITAKPSVVLWIYYENDLPDLARERGSRQMLRYLDPAYRQDLPARQPAIDSSLHRWIDARYADTGEPNGLTLRITLRGIVTLRSLRGLLDQLRSGEARDPRAQLPLFSEVLRAAKDRSEAIGARLVFVFLPQWGRSFDARRLPFDAARPEVLAAAREAGLPVIDLTTTFTTHNRRDLLFAHGDMGGAHYSPLGYQVAASLILAGLDSLELLPID